MRIVRFDSDERVDLPDMTQVSFLVLGEFRRTLRGLLIGPNGTAFDNFVVRGFAVEAQAVADATVRVRLQIGGQPLAFAIGSENLGSRMDAGQLMGGDGMDGSLEGNANTNLDFTGQPIGTYTVQMRFVYTTGTNDNRAFWDPSLLTESIDPTDTRTLPVIELRLSGAPSAEWITLATVAWGGATIVAGNITDARTFVLEGTTPYQQATQGGTGGIADFSRSSDRAANGKNEVYPALRALARQVQDIKGQDSAGEFNWWNRIYGAFDPGTGMPAGQTKTLRTLETVTYVVGDGSTTFGDFNGVNGFDTLLQLLDAQDNTMAQCVTIVLRSYASGGFQWNVGGNRVLGSAGFPRRVVIKGEGAGAVGAGNTPLSFAGVTSGTAITLAEGTLELFNLGNPDAVEVTHNITLFNAPIFRAFNCRFYGRRTEGVSSLPAVRITGGGDFSAIVNSTFRGLIKVDPGPISDGVDEGLLFDRCSTDSGCIQLANFNSGTQTAIRNVRITNCDLTMDQTHGWGLKGAIDIGNNNTITVEDCRVVFCSDKDGIHGEENGGVTPSFVYVRGCEMGFSTTAPTHTISAGQNGANGTGFCVYVSAGAGGFDSATGIHVSECTFECGTQSVDGGGVQLINTYSWSITNNEWFECGNRDVAHNEFFTSIIIRGNPTAYNTKGAIVGNTIHRWAFGAATRSGGILISGVDNVKIADNSFFGNADDESDITGRAASASAIVITASQYVGIMNNHFEGWEPDTSNSRCIVSTTGSGSVRYLTINGNTFNDNGGFGVNIVGVNYGTCNGNTLNIDVTTGDGFSFSGCEGYVANDNSFHFASGTKTAITFGAANNNVAMGNRALNGDIKKSSGTVRGYNEVTDLNLVNAYS